MYTTRSTALTLGLLAAAFALAGAVGPRAAAAASHRAPRLDLDGDGLSNRTERQLGTDPRNPDTDADGLTDGEEVTVLHTDPTNADTDADGTTDGEEVAAGTDPTTPDDPTEPGSGADVAPGDGTGTDQATDGSADDAGGSSGSAPSVDGDASGGGHDGAGRERTHG